MRLLLVNGNTSREITSLIAEEARRYLAAQVPVGEHLADQLLLPLALGAGGIFRTVKPSLHCTTQLRLLGDVLGVRAIATEERDDVWRVEVDAARG